MTAPKDQGPDPGRVLEGGNWIPDPTGLVAETAPEVGRRLRAAGVDAVVIGTT